MRQIERSWRTATRGPLRRRARPRPQCRPCRPTSSPCNQSSRSWDTPRSGGTWKSSTGASRSTEPLTARFSGWPSRTPTSRRRRLSFGPAREAAEAVRDSLELVARSSPQRDQCRVEALVARAVAAVRAIQVLQAPHIAEADDAAMSRMEQQMAAAEAAARSAIASLKTTVPRLGRAPARRRDRRSEPIYNAQHRAHRALSPQQQRPLPGVVARTEAHADRRVRGVPRRTPEDACEAGLHRHTITRRLA